MTNTNFKRIGRALLCVAVYLAATLWLTWPLAPQAATSVGFSNEVWHADYLLGIWILRWELHALGSGAPLLDANAFHPAPAVLAQSELTLGLLPPYGLLFGLTGNPVLALNVLTLASFVLAGLAMHLLVKRWTGSDAAAYASGLSFAFAPWRLMTVGGAQIVPPTGAPHLLQTQYLPLIALALDAASRTQRRRWVVAAAVLLAVQTATAFYLGYMAFVFAGALIVAFVPALAVGHARQERSLRTLVAPVAAIVFGALLVLPTALPFLRMHATGALAPDWSAGQQIIAATLGSPRVVVAAYAGVATAVLAALVVFRGRGLAEPRVLGLLLAALASVLLAPGPAGVLDGWLAPYAWLAAIVPGLTNVRSTWRFGILTGFAVSALAGIALRDVLARIPNAALSTVVAGATILVLLWPAAAGPRLVTVDVPSTSDVPAVYGWLAAHGEHGAVVELPLGRLAGEVLHGAEAMYFSTHHWLPVLNGHTGYPPASYTELKPFVERLPDRDALQVLVACAQLRWIVLHQPADHPEPAWDHAPGLVARGVFPDRGGIARLYEVAVRADAACPLPFATQPAGAASR